MSLYNVNTIRYIYKYTKYIPSIDNGIELLCPCLFEFYMGDINMIGSYVLKNKHLILIPDKYRNIIENKQIKRFVIPEKDKETIVKDWMNYEDKYNKCKDITQYKDILPIVEDSIRSSIRILKLSEEKHQVFVKSIIRLYKGNIDKGIIIYNHILNNEDIPIKITNQHIIFTSISHIPDNKDLVICAYQSV